MSAEPLAFDVSEPPARRVRARCLPLLLNVSTALKVAFVSILLLSAALLLSRQASLRQSLREGSLAFASAYPAIGAPDAPPREGGARPFDGLRVPGDVFVRRGRSESRERMAARSLSRGPRPSCGEAMCGSREDCVVVGGAFVRRTGEGLVAAPEGTEDFRCLEVCEGVSDELLERSGLWDGTASRPRCDVIGRRPEWAADDHCRFFGRLRPVVEEANVFLGLQDCWTDEDHHGAESEGESKSWLMY